MNRFVDVINPWSLENQRYTGSIKMCLKSRRAFKCANIKLVRVFERYLCLVCEPMKSRRLMPASQGFQTMMLPNEGVGLNAKICTFDEITELVASGFPMRLRRLSVYGPIDIGRGARFNSQFHEFQHSFCARVSFC